MKHKNLKGRTKTIPISEGYDYTAGKLCTSVKVMVEKPL